VSANDLNFVKIVQELFDEDDLNDADVELNCSEPVLTSDHDTTSQLSTTDENEGYSGESLSPDESSSFKKVF
jgi:hypothetical protein